MSRYQTEYCKQYLNPNAEIGEFCIDVSMFSATKWVKRENGWEIEWHRFANNHGVNSYVKR